MLHKLLKRKMLGACVGAYFIFLIGIIAMELFFHRLLLWLLLPLALIPAVVFFRKVYRPLNQISCAASRCIQGDTHPSLDCSSDDEMGTLAESVNYLIESVNNSSESQRKFVSNISHDFRSPLTSIKGYVEAILDGTIPVEMQDKYLHIVLDETERLNKLTEGLLTLNTFDDRGVLLDMTDFDLVPVIHHTTDALEGLCLKKNLTIRTEFTAPSVMVHADMGKIQQVLYNLLDNAIKFSDNNSEILVRINNQKSRVFVSVRDHGEGIAKENLPKIWERFYKTDTSRGRDKKGTGLGLSIVKEIIRAHDQNIDVISTAGVGSEFIFTLERV